ncbi:restriction endonuclease subunit S, partial [Neisseria sp. P0001.S003]
YQGQSAQPGLSVNTLSKIELKLPDKKTQDSIFSLLSALDKKIALNKQINARLEEMAKTLYDYWFVQFDFPDANGKPYK